MKQLKINLLLKHVLLSALVVGSTFNTAAFADQAIIVGGGGSLTSSQAQIELNVKWAQGILARSGLEVTTFYTDGDADTLDVHYRLTDESEASALLPLAKVFGNSIEELSANRNHTVPGVVESTARNKLEPILELLLGKENTESSLFLFNGHGGPTSSTPDQVTLQLWDDTELTASDLNDILTNNQAPFKFIFTQCYSGGFHRLAYKNPASGLELADTQRCGFTSESAYQTAEGCSASINSEDYRDYTTYFFAALSGYDRDGEIIVKDPDLNADKIVSLREAHLFTLEQAYNTDLSRSTSEDYLTTWEPWFLKWLPGSSYLPNNEYAKLFRDIAAKYDVPLEKGASKHIRTKQISAQSDFENLIQEHIKLRNELQESQQALQSKVIAKWPSLNGPYTGAFAEFVKSEQLGAVSDWIKQQPQYLTITTLEKLVSKQEESLLDSERSMTQLSKLMRLRRLANLKQWLYDYGTAEDIAGYERLVSCEEQPLNP